jgi:hypothetical protein
MSTTQASLRGAYATKQSRMPGAGLPCRSYRPPRNDECKHYALYGSYRTLNHFHFLNMSENLHCQKLVAPVIQVEAIGAE